MRGPQTTFIGKRRQGRIIRTVGEQGQWHGKRGRATLHIFKATQLNIENKGINFSATLFYERVNGAADTVVEAIGRLEDWYRERTRQHDPRRKGLDNNSSRPGLPGNRRTAGTPTGTPRNRKRKAPRTSTRRRKGDQ